MGKQKGFSVVLLVAGIALVVLAGAVGYYVVTKNNENKNTATTSQTESNTSTAAGTTESIDALTAQEASGEASLDSGADQTEQSAASSTNDALSSVGGSVDESSL